jgi:tetratricopeptide (TPR) repeat protein
VRSSGGSTRPSSTTGLGSTSRTPRVTGTTGSSSSGRVPNVGSSTQPRVRYVSPTTRTTGTTADSTRTGSTAPTYGDSRSTGASTGSTNAPSYDRTPDSTGTTRSTDSIGEAYQPASRSRFPLPLTSRDPEGTASVEANGRTTYARRFDALGTAARAAAADRIRAENGIEAAGEVSLDDIRDRYRGDTSTTGAAAGYRSRLSEVLAENSREASKEGVRVRSSSGPGARYRQQIAEEARALEAADKAPSPERIRYNVANPNDDTREDLAGLGIGKAKLGESGSSTEGSGQRVSRPAPTAKQADTQARLRQVFDAEGARGAYNAAEVIADATGVALGAATRATLGKAGSDQLKSTFSERKAYNRSNGLTGTAPGAGTGGTGGSDFDGYDDDSYSGTTFYGYPNGSHSSWGLGFGYWDSNGYYHSPYSSWFNWSFGWCSSFGLNYGYGYPYYNSGYYSPTSYYYPYVSSYYGNSYGNGYGDGYDDGYSSGSYGNYSEPVVVNVYQDGPVGEVVYVDDELAVVLGAAPAASAAPDAADAPLSAAALRYLELGDEAFGGGRYADAVHFYSRSIEFEPKRGMLHLVLADALFATGDYHYCAHTIRRALELEPSLVAAPVDKHLFYTVPAEFDQQLAVLELFLADNPTNVDAKLVLGLNYLFGNRPQAAVELLSKGPNASAAFSDNAAELIKQSAEIHQWGDNPPSDAIWK